MDDVVRAFATCGNVRTNNYLFNVAVAVANWKKSVKLLKKSFYVFTYKKFVYMPPEPRQWCGNDNQPAQEALLLML